MCKNFCSHASRQNHLDKRLFCLPQAASRPSEEETLEANQNTRPLGSQGSCGTHHPSEGEPATGFFQKRTGSFSTQALSQVFYLGVRVCFRLGGSHCFRHVAGWFSTRQAGLESTFADLRITPPYRPRCLTYSKKFLFSLGWSEAVCN